MLGRVRMDWRGPRSFNHATHELRKHGKKFSDNFVWSVCSVVGKSNLRFDPAGAGETPTAQGFIDRKQSRDHKNQSQPKFVIHQNDSRDEAERTDDTARNASMASDVRAEEIAHGEKIARFFQKPRLPVNPLQRIFRRR